MSKKKRAIDIETCSVEELRDAYRRLLASRDGVRERNKSLTEWLERVTDSVTTLSTEGSLAFQAMAEKAGVRGHPSVTAVVGLFDSIAHPQWSRGEKPEPVEFPTDWDFDKTDEQSGDADMLLNSVVPALVDAVEAIQFSFKQPTKERLGRMVGALLAGLGKRVEGVKDAAGFKPRHVTVPTGPLAGMDAEHLRMLVSALGWFALDIAQDLHFANQMLRRDLRAAAYMRACNDLYRLSQLAVDESPPDHIDIKVFGDVVPE